MVVVGSFLNELFFEHLLDIKFAPYLCSRLLQDCDRLSARMAFLALQRVQRIALPDTNAIINIAQFVSDALRAQLQGRCIDDAYIVRAESALDKAALEDLMPMCDLSLADSYTYVDVPVAMRGYKAPTESVLLNGRVTRQIPDMGCVVVEYSVPITWESASVTIAYTAILTFEGAMPAIGAELHARIEHLEYAANAMYIRATGHVLKPALGPRGLFDLKVADEGLLSGVRELFKAHGALMKTSPAYAEACRIYANSAWVPLEQLQAVVHQSAHSRPIDLMGAPSDMKPGFFYANLHNITQLLVYSCDAPNAGAAEHKKDIDTNAILVAIQAHLQTMATLAR